MRALCVYNEVFCNHPGIITVETTYNHPRLIQASTQFFVTKCGWHTTTLLLRFFLTLCYVATGTRGSWSVIGVGWRCNNQLTYWCICTKNCVFIDQLTHALCKHRPDGILYWIQIYIVYTRHEMSANCTRLYCTQTYVLS